MFQTILFYLITFAFTGACVMYTKYQFEDEQAGWAHAKSEWHRYGAFQRSTPFLVALLVGQTAWPDVLLAASICIPAFEIGVNKIALHMPTFYNGKTSILDKSFGNKKWYYMAALLFVAAVLKFTPLKFLVEDLFRMVGHWIYSK